jgi:hypothetical protein
MSIKQATKGTVQRDLTWLTSYVNQEVVEAANAVPGTRKIHQ